jgi:hypothetical protein
LLGLRTGRGNAEAAREADLGGEDGKRARQEGYRLASHPGVLALLERAGTGDFDAVLAAAEKRAPEFGRLAALEEHWVKTGSLPDTPRFRSMARDIAVEAPANWHGWREYGADPGAFDALVSQQELRAMLVQRIQYYRELIAELDGPRMNGG